MDYTWCWIQESNNPPEKPEIQGPTNGKTGESYDYTFVATEPDGTDLWYFIDWGDETNTGWLGPYESGEIITKSHIWSEEGNFIIKAKAKDPYDAEGPWGELTVTIPRNKAIFDSLFLRFLERFPLLEKMLNLIIKI